MVVARSGSASARALRRLALVALVVAASCGGAGPSGRDLDAPDADASAAPAGYSLRDDFERGVDGGWGAAGDEAWDYVPTAGESFELSVSGGRAHAAAPAGVNKGNFLVGPPLAGATTVRATFTIDDVPARGETNHVHVLARSDGMRTYYAFLLYPYSDRRAAATIFSAKGDRYRTLGERPTPFVVEEGRPYVVEGRVRDRRRAAALELRVWEASQTRPAAPVVAARDRDRPIRGGRAGVRLSFYAGPSSMTVDDFAVTAEASAGEPQAQP